MKTYKVYVKGKVVCITSDKIFADFMNKDNKPNIFKITTRVPKFLVGKRVNVGVLGMLLLAILLIILNIKGV